MPSQQASLWQGLAALRGMEGFLPKGARLFADPLGLRLLAPFWRRLLTTLHRLRLLNVVLALRDRRAPGVVDALRLRTRYFDDAVRQALADGLKQVVILGAGFDTRPYRLRAQPDVTWYEVDHPDTQRLKRSRLLEALRALPDNVEFVPLDFDRQILATAMAGSSFSGDRRALFIWEGVTQYIGARAVDATLEFVANGSAPGSRVGFSYVRQEVIDGSSRTELEESMLSGLSRAGVPWIFGISPDALAPFLSARGFELVEEVGVAECRARYLPNRVETRQVFDSERLVVARSRRPDRREAG